MSAQRRRPGPRRDLDVRTRLVEVAEELFAERPAETVSMRSVARHAGVAPAALNHHFPSKDALLEAVVQRRSGRFVERAAALLDELEQPGAKVTARRWVEAVITPLTEIVAAEPVSGMRWAKVFLRLGLATDPIYVREVLEPSDLAQRYLRTATLVLPGLSEREVGSRIGIAVFALFSTLLSIDVSGSDRLLESGGLDPQFVERLVAFTSSGLTNKD